LRGHFEAGKREGKGEGREGKGKEGKRRKKIPLPAINYFASELFN